ncbi:hypothetical protein FAIPA1_20093 [Frankia sp. AiPs1]
MRDRVAMVPALAWRGALTTDFPAFGRWPAARGAPAVDRINEFSTDAVDVWGTGC